MHGRWHDLGATLRVYLTGRVTIEGPDAVVDQTALPGRQGRRALVHLVAERDHPVPIDVLAVALWPDELPRSWETSLRAVVSKLRPVLAAAGVDPDVLIGESGCYQLRIPDAWVDLDAAGNHLDRAEGALRTADVTVAWSEAAVATAIARRPLLPGEDDPWLAAQRDRLRGLHLRALDCLVAVWTLRGEHRLAAETARQALALAPFRESGYRQLMRAQVAAGDRAEAVRTYGQCRRLLGEELGVAPSPETEAVYLEALDA